MTEPTQDRKEPEPELTASIAARQMYLAAIRRCDGFLQVSPGAYEVEGVRFYLKRALVSEAKAVEPYRQPWTEAEMREAWGL